MTSHSEIESGLIEEKALVDLTLEDYKFIYSSGLNPRLEIYKSGLDMDVKAECKKYRKFVKE